jgi:hypothetical protein
VVLLAVAVVGSFGDDLYTGPILIGLALIGAFQYAQGGLFIFFTKYLSKHLLWYFILSSAYLVSVGLLFKDGNENDSFPVVFPPFFFIVYFLFGLYRSAYHKKNPNN